MARIHESGIFDSTISADDGSESLEDKIKRVKRELAAAGATIYGLAKFNSRYLPKIIHSNENIRAVIYGRYTEGPGLLSLTDRMVVATDRRVISLNHKPGYTDIDEFTFDVIDGIEESRAGPFASVKINTKIAPFSIRFVRIACAEKFVHFIEKRRLEYFDKKTASRS